MKRESRMSASESIQGWTLRRRAGSRWSRTALVRHSSCSEPSAPVSGPLMISLGKRSRSISAHDNSVFSWAPPTIMRVMMCRTRTGLAGASAGAPGTIGRGRESAAVIEWTYPSTPRIRSWEPKPLWERPPGVLKQIGRGEENLRPGFLPGRTPARGELAQDDDAALGRDAPVQCEADEVDGAGA